jgi:hypothetical protein
MTPIRAHEWDFSEIRKADPACAGRLENCGPASELVQAIAKAASRRERRIIHEEPHSRFKATRCTIEFWVSPEIYDWFFNARAGYRAPFWISPETGIHLNRAIVEAIIGVLAKCSAKLLNSVRHPEAKIWISEREGWWVPLYHAERLVVPRWAVGDEPEGLRAPFPTTDESWLELKGAYFRDSGELCECSHSDKPLAKRARQLHDTGWT